MQTVSVRELKNNPSVALRQAKTELTVITNRNTPDALLVSMEQLRGIPNLDQVRLVMALQLFQDKKLSIAAAAKVAGKSLSEMLTLVSEQGIPVVDYDEEELQREADTVKQLLKKREQHKQ